MDTITVSLTDDRLLELRKRAARLHISAEELVRASIEELLTRPEPAFEDAVRYVLQKNADLYKRLA